MMQRVSTFQKQVIEKHEVNENMLEKTFTAIYWLAKEEISNQKLIPLLELLENLGVSELTYFQHRSRPTVREMFITLGESIQEIILERIRRAKSLGILASDEKLSIFHEIEYLKLVACMNFLDLKYCYKYLQLCVQRWSFQFLDSLEI